VRELENKIKVACLLGDEANISAQDLGLASVTGAGVPLNLKEVRNRAERDAVTRAMSASAGNVSRAAELLGVSRPTLYDLMSRHDLAATGSREAIVPESAGGAG
jgi:two-component system, NtrC family, response regulator